MRSVWLLFVFQVPDRHGGLLTRLGFRQTKKNRAHWWRRFDPANPYDKPAAEEVRVKLAAAGLVGKWKEVPAELPAISAGAKKSAKRKKRDRLVKQQTPPQVSAEILTLQVAKENRLARDALKLAIEKRRQAEKRAQREAYQRAEVSARRAAEAVQRANGDAS
jgi:hypothetical protein